MVKSNVGTVDRVLRVVLGVALLYWFYIDQTTGFWHYAKLIGVMPILTAVVGSCPLYSVLGLATRPVKS